MGRQVADLSQPGQQHMDISRRRFIKTASGTLAIGVAAGSAAAQVSAAGSTKTTDFPQRAPVNQAKLTSELRLQTISPSLVPAPPARGVPATSLNSPTPTCSSRN